MTTTTKESVSSRRPLALLLVWSAALALVACGKVHARPRTSSTRSLLDGRCVVATSRPSHA